MEDSTGQATGASATPVVSDSMTAPIAAASPSALSNNLSDTLITTLSAPEPTVTPVIREDQIQNAVGFLSHPQVRSSTNTASKRSFLERKGLTAAEIDEAFRRVPEAPPSPAPAPAAPAPTAPSPASTAAAVPQAPMYAPQTTAQPNTSATVSSGSQMVALQPPAPMAVVSQVAPGYRWSQVVLGVGAVFAAGWAVHQLVVPRLWALVESWQAYRREAEEARHKELHAAVASLKGCQEELKVSTQALMEAVNLMREQQRPSTIDGIVPTRGAAGRPIGAPPPRDTYYQGMNGRADNPYGGTGVTLGAENYAALRAAAGYTNAYPPDPPSYSVSYNYGRGDSGPAIAGPTGGDGSRSGNAMYVTSNTPYGAVRSTTGTPYGGPVGGNMGQQQQENLPYRVTAPPSPAHSTHSLQPGRQQQPLGGLGGASDPYGSSDRLYEQSGPGAGQGPKPTAASAASSSRGTDGRTVPPPPPEQPAYPESFMSLMEMVQQGITPPNVRTDINDAPPDPTRPLSEALMPAPLKPWERAAAGGGGNGAGMSMPEGGMSSAGKLNGTPLYSWGMGSQMEQSPMMSSSSLSLPTTTYDLLTATGGVVGASGSAGSSTAGGSTGRVSNGGGASGSGLSVLPPANPAWRPPPPPARTVPSSNPSSPPSSSQTGTTGTMEAAPTPSMGAGPAAAASNSVSTSNSGTPATASGALVMGLVEPAASLAGPPSPSPTQPTLGASANEILRALDEPLAVHLAEESRDPGETGGIAVSSPSAAPSITTP